MLYDLVTLIKKEMLYAHLTSYSFDFLKISNIYQNIGLVLQNPIQTFPKKKEPR
jgi:hypothetical protein